MKLSNSTEIIQTLNPELLLNIQINEKVLNTLIESDRFPCLHYIYHINRLIMKDYYPKEEILKHKEIFFKNKKSFELLTGIPNVIINKEALFDDRNCLLSQFSCINLIERILKYGKFKNNTILDFNDEWLTKILLLNVIETGIDETDEDESSDDTLDLYLSIITYNQFPNDINNSNYFRLSYIYDNYIKYETEILEKFKKKNGYSIKSYLLFLQMFFSLGTYYNPFIEANCFNNSELAIEIKKCINNHIFNHFSSEEKEKIVINSYIPSSVLLNKPILDFDGKYLIINPGFLMSRIYGIFFKKIKSSIGDNALFRKRFYGPLFENYCRDIARLNVSRSNFKYYKFIEPFTYEKNGKIIDSSDFYINYKDITIIFEIKSTQRYNETTVQTDIAGKEKFIKEEFNKKIKEPLEQIEKRLDEIKQLNPTLYPDIPLINIQNSKNYYYIVVSDESIINNYRFYTNYLSKLKPNYSKYIPLYLNISEFEYLMMSLYKRKKTIDKLIEHYHKQYYSSNFSSMVHSERKTFKFSRLNIFDEYPYKNELKSILINNI